MSVQAAWVTRLPQHWALFPRLLSTLVDDGAVATVAPPLSKTTHPHLCVFSHTML